MINKLYVTGDCHGVFTRFKNLPEFNMQETIGIIVLGDFGVNFFLNETDDKKKKELSTNYPNFIFYCVRGNHEARPQDIDGIKLIYDENVNGDVYIEDAYPYIRYFKDFGLYTINNFRIAVIGGAYSVDKWYRLARFGIKDKSNPDYYNSKKTGWFPNEQLSINEKNRCINMMKGQNVNFVFSHTCPIEWEPRDLFLSTIDQTKVDKTTEIFLSDVLKNIYWQVWCFGHFHADRIERPYVEMFYNDIESLDSIWDRWDTYVKTGEVPWWMHKSPNFYQFV